MTAGNLIIMQKVICFGGRDAIIVAADHLRPRTRIKRKGFCFCMSK